MANSDEARDFSLTEARNLIKDLARPIMAVYWIDFLTSISVAWVAFIFTIALPINPPVRILLGLVSSLAFYRSTIFIHELTHVRRGVSKAFRIIWNFLCGFAVMLPSFVYKGVHNEHHIRKVYGTKEDGEYWPLVSEGRRYEILAFPIIGLLLPFYYAIRFIVLTPLLVFSKKLRSFVWSWFSSLAIIMKYKRPLPESKSEARDWLFQEWMACLYGITATVLIIVGVLPYTVAILWYCVSAVSFVLNSFRTLAAHAYRNPGDNVMTQSEQLLDSVSVPGFLFLPALWAPVGLRYHATHHLFPIMPYHALGKAHRRLIKMLPGDSRYLETVRTSLWDALKRIWRETPK